MSSAEMGKQTRKRVFDAINSYIDLHQYPPTIREIGEMVGLKSTCTVNHHVKMLLLSGELETDHGSGTPRALRVPSRAAKFDALYLAKCQEVNELRARIENMTDQREADCCEWKRNENTKVLILSPHNPHSAMWAVDIKMYPYCNCCGKRIKVVE